MGKRRLKVLLLSSVLNVRGAERLLLEIARRLDKDKYEVVVCSLRHSAPMAGQFRELGLRVEVLEMRAFVQPGPLWRLYRLLRDEHIDVLHTSLFRDAIYGRLLGRLAGVPVIVNFMHMGHRAFWRYWLNRWTAGMADRVLPLSHTVERLALEQDRFPADKLEVVYQGLDLSEFSPAPRSAELARSLGLDSARPIVGTVAALIPQKGHRYLIEAMPAVREVAPGAQLLFVGKGPLRAELEGMCRERQQKAVFLDEIPNIADALGMMDVYVQPSLQEGIPQAVLEAMAMCKPAVATDVDGNPEAVVDGVTGLVVPPRQPGALAAAVCRLLAEPALAVAMGQAGRRRIEEQFTLDRMVRRIEQIYDELYAARATCPARTRAQVAQ
ncbi:MAG: glycosyltransferase [Bacteroidetes bacterium]|nr:glycosyltransferase [Bacteroidota bacterium]MCL5026215.1 glycosyltransferase [Chloroflexota bacterium]